jgi:hypothetical protein
MHAPTTWVFELGFQRFDFQAPRHHNFGFVSELVAPSRTTINTSHSLLQHKYRSGQWDRRRSRGLRGEFLSFTSFLLSAWLSASMALLGVAVLLVRAWGRGNFISRSTPVHLRRFFFIFFLNSRYFCGWMLVLAEVHESG